MDKDYIFETLNKLDKHARKTMEFTHKLRVYFAESTSSCDDVSNVSVIGFDMENDEDFEEYEEYDDE